MSKSLYELLTELVADLPPVPKRYELHCHPGVYLALMNAYGREYSPPGYVMPPPVYGTADVKVNPDFAPGYWEMRENGTIVDRGILDTVIPPKSEAT